MADKKRRPNLAGLIVVGCGLVAVGISTKNWGLMSAGIVFIIIGAADVVRARRERGPGESGDDQRKS